MTENKYKKAIASELNCEAERVFLYWKGRVALYAILKAMGIQKDDEILIPAFTCVVVPNAIIYLGAKPVYVDILPQTLNMDINLLQKAITSKTKAIICQNTFGLSSNIEEVIQIAKEKDLFTIEDCTHGFGGTYNGKPNGSYCDAAFYSTQWNKPFSTGIGGFSVINKTDLVDKVTQLENKKIQPSMLEQFALLLLLIFNKYIINEFTYWSLVKFYRFLSKNNLIIGSNQGDELSGIKMPAKYFKNISATQTKAGIRELTKLKRMGELRKTNAVAYTKFLKEHFKVYVNENLFENHLFLKYPILVLNRELFIKLAEKERISLGDWFLSPIHPIKENFELWSMNLDRFPVAKKISSQIVNLPTDVKGNKKVIDFLITNLEMIE